MLGCAVRRLFFVEKSCEAGLLNKKQPVQTITGMLANNSALLILGIILPQSPSSYY
jgi:hypothetical protein